MSLDSEVPPSKYLSSESRENTKLLKSLVKKSANHGSGSSTSHKMKAMSNKVQNCQDCVAEVDQKVQGVEERHAAELRAMRVEFDKKLLVITSSLKLPEAAEAAEAKSKEVDVAIKELYKKMTYIESIVLNLSKSFYDVDDTELKSLIEKTGSSTIPVASALVDSVGGAQTQSNSLKVEYSI